MNNAGFPDIRITQHQHLVGGCKVQSHFVAENATPQMILCISKEEERPRLQKIRKLSNYHELFFFVVNLEMDEKHKLKHKEVMMSHRQNKALFVTILYSDAKSSV